MPIFTFCSSSIQTLTKVEKCYNPQLKSFKIMAKALMYHDNVINKCHVFETRVFKEWVVFRANIFTYMFQTCSREDRCFHCLFKEYADQAKIVNTVLLMCKTIVCFIACGQMNQFFTQFPRVRVAGQISPAAFTTEIGNRKSCKGLLSRHIRLAYCFANIRFFMKENVTSRSMNWNGSKTDTKGVYVLRI